MAADVFVAVGLVDVIHSIFYSVKCSPITKEEILHKTIMNSLDFVEISMN